VLGGDEPVARPVVQEVVSCVVVIAGCRGVERNDSLLVRRDIDALPSSGLVLQLLAKVEHVGEGRVRIVERLLERLAGVVKRFEFRAIDRRGCGRLGQRGRDRRAEEECSPEDLHAGPPSEEAIIASPGGETRLS
jgi:hypothetical protein